jgi:UDP-N-acetylglucosamine acyltransferase
MSIDIHPTAIVDSGAKLEDGVKIGPYSQIGPDVHLGKRVIIDSNVVIDGNTSIGEDCHIFHSTVVGMPPQDLKYQGEPTRTVIDSGTIIREFVTVHRSTNLNDPTRIGKNCLLMAYVHVAHDCQIGDNVILANCVNLSGHISIEHHTSIGGMTPVHQFVKIGCFAFIGGLSRVTKDVAPYTLGAGAPYKTYGLNVVGLRRNNFSEDTIKQLKKVSKIFYYSHLNTTQAVNKIKREVQLIPEIQHFLEFVAESTRGIAK